MTDQGGYPPPTQPSATYSPPSMPPPPLPPAAGPSGPSWWQHPIPLWALLVTAIVALGIGAAAGNGSKKEETKTASASSSSSSSSPTTTEKATTTTSTSTTTTVPPTTTTTAPPQPITVLDVSGSNKTNSDNFTVSGRWTIHAEVSGGAGLGVVIINAANDSHEDFLTFDEGGGDSAQRGSGTFYLELTPFGSTYHVTVIDEVG